LIYRRSRSDKNLAGVLSGKSDIYWCWRPPPGTSPGSFTRAGSCDVGGSQAAKDVEESQDLLIDLFERIENFFRRLEVYTKVPPTPAMTDMMVKIMVEVLDILGTATKEMRQSRASEFIYRLLSVGAHVIVEKFLKKIAGIRKLEDGLKRLDKMTNDEARMANAEVMRIAHDINTKVDSVNEAVQGVGAQVKGVHEKLDEKVQGIDEKVLGVSENVKEVKEKVQTVIGGAKTCATNHRHRH
jgi:uncharacterized protein YoxC